MNPLLQIAAFTGIVLGIAFIPVFIVYVIIGITQGFKDAWARMFNRWTKWEVYAADQPYIQTTFCSPLLGHYKTGESRVLVDIYVRTHKFNGIKQYKKVVKT